MHFLSSVFVACKARPVRTEQGAQVSYTLVFTLNIVHKTVWAHTLGAVGFG